MYNPTRRWRGVSLLQMGSWLLVFLALSLSWVSPTSADSLTQDYCSSQNTAETDASSSRYQSNGLCKTTCQGNYALAIVQGSNCWCSNYIPADQLSVSSDCNKECQGYPYENCGNSDTGTFGYILLGKSPSGTASASQASDTSSASSESFQTPTPQSSSSSPQSTSSSQQSSSSPPTTSAAPTTSSDLFVNPKSQSSPSSTWTPTPITSVQVVTVSNRPITQTVTTMPTVPPNEASTEKVQSKGVSGGLIAGIVIATVLASLILAGVLFWCWRRRRQVQQEQGIISGSGPPSTRPTRNTSVLSRTGLLEKVYPSVAVRPRSHVGSQSNTLGPDGSGGISPVSEKRNSRPLFYDQRLNPTTLMDFDNGSRVSVNTLPDNRDFSRPLNITNPDLDRWD